MGWCQNTTFFGTDEIEWIPFNLSLLYKLNMFKCCTDYLTLETGKLYFFPNKSQKTRIYHHSRSVKCTSRH